MADQIVHVGLQGNTVTKAPNDGNLVAPVGAEPTIIWTAENEPNIDRISSVVIHNDWPTQQPQPQPGNHKVWSVHNKNDFRKIYNYDVTVETPAGKKFSDPEIENMGKNGEIDPDDKDGEENEPQ